MAFVAAGDRRKWERTEASHGPGARKVWCSSNAYAEAEFAKATRQRADDAGFSFVDDFRAGGIDENAVGRIGGHERGKLEQAAGERVQGVRVSIGPVRFGVKCDIRWEKRARMGEVHCFGNAAGRCDFAAAGDEFASGDFAREENGERGFGISR